MTPDAEQIATLADFIPHLHTHIADRCLTITTSGIQIRPDWYGWNVTAECCDAAGDDVTVKFSADEAAEFLHAIDA